MVQEVWPRQPLLRVFGQQTFQETLSGEHQISTTINPIYSVCHMPENLMSCLLLYQAQSYHCGYQWMCSAFSAKMIWLLWSLSSVADIYTRWLLKIKGSKCEYFGKEKTDFLRFSNNSLALFFSLFTVSLTCLKSHLYTKQMFALTQTR